MRGGVRNDRQVTLLRGRDSYENALAETIFDLFETEVVPLMSRVCLESISGELFSEANALTLADVVMKWVREAEVDWGRINR